MKWRRPALDGDILGRLEMAPRERVLAWADDGFGRPVVASDNALHVQRLPPDYSRFGWEQIERASYDAGTLTVVLSADLGGATLQIPVGDGRDVPVVVRDRVTATVLVDRFFVLDGEWGVRIVGRRGPSGDVAWRADLDPQLTDDPAARADAAVVLAEVKAEVGGG
ncbi:MAG: hypothetical protein ABI720_10845 [Actinomycetes bacterium]